MSASTEAPKLDAPQPRKKLAPSGGMMMNLGTRDPFAEADAFSQPSRSGAGTPSNEADLPGGSGGKIHIRIQQRNGRKMITSVQGLDKAYDAKKILKAFKKEFACNGTVVSSEEAAAEDANADESAEPAGKSSSAHVKTAAPTNKGKDFGQVIQLQGDQRVHVREFLINTGIVSLKDAKEKIQVHGH